MTEHQIQSAYILICKCHEAKYPALKLLFAVPNGGHRHIAVATKLRAEGVRAGVPDVMLPVARKIWCGMAIEFKSTSGKLTESQAEYIRMLREEGWYVELCTDALDAWELTKRYLSQPDTEENEYPKDAYELGYQT